MNTANALDATNNNHSTRAMIAAPFFFMPNRTDYPWSCDGACDGFCPATPERIGAASLADAQSDAVGSKQVAPINVSRTRHYTSLARGTKKSRQREIAPLFGTQLPLRMKMIEFPRGFPLRTLVVCFTVWLIATEVLVFDQIKFDTRTHLLEQAARGFHGAEVIVPNERPSHVPSGANMQTL